MIAAIAAAFLAAVTAGPKHPTPEYPASQTFLAQRQIIEEMNSVYPDVEVDVRWEPCEEENSFYQPSDQSIHLCTEFEAYPGAAVYVAAHEMAHAIQMQRLDTTGEQDADELAALALIHFGHQQALLDGALYWRTQDRQAHHPGDEHPGAGFRGWELACIEDGSEPDGSAECKALYQGLRIRWNTRLATP
jgi:hypothetical protein